MDVEKISYPNDTQVMPGLGSEPLPPGCQGQRGIDNPARLSTALAGPARSPFIVFFHIITNAIRQNIFKVILLFIVKSLKHWDLNERNSDDFVAKELFGITIRFCHVYNCSSINIINENIHTYMMSVE